MLPYNPTALSAASSTNDSMLRIFLGYQHANRFYNEASEEVREANMPTTVGILPLILRVGNPKATYKLNKIESPDPNSDHVFQHMEKYCALDALWYPNWVKLSLFCEMFREVMFGVIRAPLEMPERANFMLTMTRILALPDEAPGAEGNPMSTRFRWRVPLHQYLWRDLQQGEVPGTPHFQLYPQPPQRQRVDIARFQSFKGQCYPISSSHSRMQPPPSRGVMFPSGLTTRPLLQLRKPQKLRLDRVPQNKM